MKEFTLSGFKYIIWTWRTYLLKKELLKIISKIWYKHLIVLSFDNKENNTEGVHFVDVSIPSEYPTNIKSTFIIEPVNYVCAKFISKIQYDKGYMFINEYDKIRFRNDWDEILNEVREVLKKDYYQIDDVKVKVEAVNFATTTFELECYLSCLAGSYVPFNDSLE